MTTTFYQTITQYYPGYTTTYMKTANGRETPTEVYIQPSTVIVVKKVTAAVPTDASTSDAGDSINDLNVWKEKLNRVVACLWVIGAAFVYTILA